MIIIWKSKNILFPRSGGNYENYWLNKGIKSNSFAFLYDKLFKTNHYYLFIYINGILHMASILLLRLTLFTVLFGNYEAFNLWHPSKRHILLERFAKQYDPSQGRQDHSIIPQIKVWFTPFHKNSWWTLLVLSNQ